MNMNMQNLNNAKGKTILRFVLCVLPIAIIGGYFTGIYILEHSTSEVTAQILAQIKSPTALYMLTTLQSMIYAIIASVAGYFLADRIGLLKPFAFKKDILKKTVPVIILFGILFTADYFVIGSFIPEVAADYERGISAAYFIAANITAALLFAAGHLPATMAFFGRISPLILVRCFVLNGGFALIFGRFYRKYGIQYAMLAHFGLHLISKLILLAVI